MNFNSGLTRSIQTSTFLFTLILEFFPPCLMEHLDLNCSETKKEKQIITSEIFYDNGYELDMMSNIL